MKEKKSCRQIAKKKLCACYNCYANISAFLRHISVASFMTLQELPHFFIKLFSTTEDRGGGKLAR